MLRQVVCPYVRATPSLQGTQLYLLAKVIIFHQFSTFLCLLFEGQHSPKWTETMVLFRIECFGHYEKLRHPVLAPLSTIHFCIFPDTIVISHKLLIFPFSVMFNSLFLTINTKRNSILLITNVINNYFLFHTIRYH